MKKCEKEMEGERARPWPGRRVIQMKLEAYEKCVFCVCVCTQMHIYWPHLITDHQSETERAWEGGRRRSHMKGDWDYMFHFSAAIVFTWKFDLLFWPIVRFYLRHFVFDREKKKQDYTVSWMQIPLFLWERKWCWGHSSLSISYSAVS